MHKERIRRLRSVLEQLQLEAIMITNVYNRKYMTGFTGTAGTALISADKAILITDFRYQTQAPKQAADFEVVIHGQKFNDTLKEALQTMGVKKLGFEQNHMSYGSHSALAADLAGVQLVPVSDAVERLRMIKDETELTVIEQACELADKTYEHIVSILKPGMSEREIALEIEFTMRKGGASGTSFETIVASGERSALPHGVASDRLLQEGDFVTMDFGALFGGYCSDITRTVMIGKPTDKHREIYGIVLEAQMQAIDRIKPGMTGKQADAIARDIIGKYGYSDYFGHGLGHSFGLEIHESPRLSLSGDIVLQPGMTVTVEPGIYIPDFGGVRIEDDVVVTDTGVRRLTRSDKQFTVIG